MGEPKVPFNCTNCGKGILCSATLRYRQGWRPFCGMPCRVDHRRKGQPDKATCKECGVEKPSRDFASRESGKLALRCRACVYAKDRFRGITKRYGLDKATMAQRMAEQGGGCAICKTPFTKHPHVDHCHKTGIVRGLLCLTCNAGIGQMRDDTNLLRAAIAYLEASTERR